MKKGIITPEGLTIVDMSEAEISDIENAPEFEPYPSELEVLKAALVAKGTISETDITSERTKKITAMKAARNPVKGGAIKGKK